MEEKKEQTGAWKVLNSPENKPIITCYEGIYHIGIFANLTGEKDKNGDLKIGYVASLGKVYRVGGKIINKQITISAKDLPKVEKLCNRAYSQFGDFCDKQTAEKRRKQELE